MIETVEGFSATRDDTAKHRIILVSDMVTITWDARLKGWDGPNGASVSFRLLDGDVAPCQADGRILIDTPNRIFGEGLA